MTAAPPRSRPPQRIGSLAPALKRGTTRRKRRPWQSLPGSLSHSPPPTLRSDLWMSGLLFVSLAIALGSMHTLLSGTAWWLSAVGVALAVLVTGALARAVFRRSGAGTIAAALAAYVTVTLAFAADTAVLGVIPTPDTLDRFAGLSRAANQSIAVQSIPAESTAGILFLLCWVVAVLAVVMDAAALWLRRPALAGLPLLVVAIAPSVVQPTYGDPVFFELIAVAYLLIIRSRGQRVQPRVALSIGAAAVLGALLVPSLLPPVTPNDSNGTGAGLLSESINPIINLGSDLRRGTPTLALTYTSSLPTGEYLRLTTLDSFQGKEWAPVAAKQVPGHTVDKISAAPGLTRSVPRTAISTTIQVANTTGGWLPVPYPPTKVSGLSGTWFWESKALAIRTDDSSIQGQKYTVDSLDLKPTSTELEKAPRSPDSPLAAVPAGLSPIVAKTAREVVGSAQTDFDKAIALQDWFRGGTFSYSERTPALSGFDGSGLDVIVPFLRTKSGYCVHFATTMAVMARTLGIPSRVAVGFLPGKAIAVTPSGLAEFKVSSTDLHAWPELFFAGIGWVRFEPTPSRGFEPNFPVAVAPGTSSLPGGTSGALPSSTPSAAPRTTPRLPSDRGGGVTGTSVGASTIGPAGWVALGTLLAILVLAAPAVTRMTVRRGRLQAIRDGKGSSGLAWLELRETALDLGFGVSDSLTPRGMAEWIARKASPPAVAAAALDRMRILIEEDAFAARPRRFIGDELARELVTVLRGLRSSARARDRVRAFLLPRTLIDRALGRGALAR